LYQKFWLILHLAVLLIAKFRAIVFISVFVFYFFPISPPILVSRGVK